MDITVYCLLSIGKEVIMWSAIEDMAVEWHCFSGSITLKLKDGAEVVLKGPKYISYVENKYSTRKFNIIDP